MSFLQKIKDSLRKFMVGRRGADELSLALLIVGLVLSMLSSITRVGLFYLIGLVAYGFSIFRMFSRNVEKRYAENMKFKSLWQNGRSGVRQFINRVKNMRKYKYFKCPECHARLRLPRKVGEVTITCGKCHHAFKQKA
ncbi:MAG: hypothetical protein IJ769_09270 [Clostridia bacterium]|nr:hypothetical protein [Clostridia bacterium]